MIQKILEHEGIDIKTKIFYKLNQLESFTEIISIATGFMKEDFIHDPLIYGGANRYILLGLEHIRDIGMMLCDIYGLDMTEHELPKLLAKNKIFPHWLAENLLNINTFFRQQHDEYEEKDPALLYGKLDQIVSDFRHFKKYVLEYLK